MPKIRQPPEVKISGNLKRNIATLKSWNGITNSDLAAAAHISRATLSTRMKTPQHFKVDELFKIAAKLHTTVARLVEANNSDELFGVRGKRGVSV